MENSPQNNRPTEPDLELVADEEVEAVFDATEPSESSNVRGSSPPNTAAEPGEESNDDGSDTTGETIIL